MRTASDRSFCSIRSRYSSSTGCLHGSAWASMRQHGPAWASMGQHTVNVLKDRVTNQGRNEMCFNLVITASGFETYSPLQPIVLYCTVLYCTVLYCTVNGAGCKSHLKSRLFGTILNPVTAVTICDGMHRGVAPMNLVWTSICSL